MDRRSFLGTLAAVLASGVVLQNTPAFAKEAVMADEQRSADLPYADLPREDAQEAQGRGRGRGRYKSNYGRRRSAYVHRRNAARKSRRRW